MMAWHRRMDGGDGRINSRAVGRKEGGMTDGWMMKGWMMDGRMGKRKEVGRIAGWADGTGGQMHGRTD